MRSLKDRRAALTSSIIQSKVYVLGLLITLNLRAGNRSTTINASFHQISSGPKVRHPQDAAWAGQQTWAWLLSRSYELIFQDTAYHMNAISSARSESEAHVSPDLSDRSRLPQLTHQLNDQKSPWSTSDRYVKPTDEETDCTGSLHEHRKV